MIRATACGLDEVRQVLAAAVSPKCDAVGKYTLDGLAAQGQCFKVLAADGSIVGAYILAAEGSEVFVTAAAGRAAFDLSVVLNGLIDSQARQFDTVAFQTQRKGLVKKAIAQGYEIAGYIMRKKLK
ncbi:hypothetical protein [Pseudoduganella aquatica]|uniref:hypothetical protein n=1 Tax=Pseudoduganella aquatica TaxID=2660641 RepID=UPI001E3229EB|nr:hypothetical protein [Pseudoduganella aquatica]